MKPIGFVYLTTNIINGKIYVGQHILSDNKKWNATYLGSGTLIEKAIKKYGRENFKRKILKVCFNINQLNGYETYYTLKYNPKLDRKIGYNQIIGPSKVCGNKNPANYPSVRKKMIEVNRKTTSDPEYRKRQSEIMKEYYKTHKPTFLGRKHSEESKKKMRLKALGRPAPNKGKPMSEEQKIKQSIAMKGKFSRENNPNFGRKHSEESKKKMSEIKKKQYKGRKWINNEEQEKFVNIDNGIPQGYLLGRLRKSIQ